MKGVLKKDKTFDRVCVLDVSAGVRGLRDIPLFVSVQNRAPPDVNTHQS